MGGHYGSIHVRTENRERVQSALTDLACEPTRRFLISPPIAGWVSVFPEHNGQDEAVSEALAKKLADVTLIHCLVHDDDIFAYWLFERGILKDRFHSSPGYFGEANPEPRGGNAAALAHLLADPGMISELQALLDAPRFTFEMERLHRFAELLQLPNAVTAYEYLQAGERDGIEKWKEFDHVPDQSAEKAARRAAAAARRHALKSLKAAGTLRVDEPARRDAGGAGPGIWMVGSGTEGVFLLRADRAGRFPDNVKWRRYGPPDWSAQPGDVPGDAKVQLAQLSCSGRLLALVCWEGAWRLSVWNRPERRQQVEYRLDDAVNALLFTPDEDRLLVSTTTPKHTLIRSFPVRPEDLSRVELSFERAVCRCLAMHPAGRWLAIELGGRLGVLDLESSSSLRLFHLGGTYDFRPALLKHLESPELEKELRKWEGSRPAGQMESLRQMLQAQRAVARQASPMPVERVAALAWTPDGHWLICGTNAGIRAFSWPKLCEAGPGEVRWDCSVEAEEPQTDDRNATPGIYAVACDGARKRVLFSGAEGKLKYLDLETNRSGDLLGEDERIPITRLALSPDRQMVAMTRGPVGGGTGPRARFQLWDYVHLCRSAGVDF